MKGFKYLEREILKNKGDFDYSMGVEGEKRYFINSWPLKQSLRELLFDWKGACEVKYDAEQNITEHKLENNGSFGIYREIDNSPDELVILDNLEEDGNFTFGNKDTKNNFFTLPKVERVTPITPIEPVRKVTPVTPVGSDDCEGYHTVFSFQKDIRTGEKTFTKTTLRGGRESERMTIEENNSPQQNPRFMGIDEDEAKQEQIPPNFHQRK